MKIDDYRFGKIVIGGNSYGNDVIVFHDRVRPEWWRRKGHSLHPDDLDDVVEANPSTLIVGTGAMGVMRIPEETKQFLEERGIRLEAYRTGKACGEYNTRSGDPSVAAAFHLTC